MLSKHPKSLLFFSISSLFVSAATLAAEPVCQQDSGKSRVRYLAPEVAATEQCISETQFASCNAEQQVAWSGSFQYLSCKVNEQVTNGQLLTSDELMYRGGFKLPLRDQAKSVQESFVNSDGVMAYNPNNESLIMVGYRGTQHIAEVAIPEIIQNNDLSLMARSDYFYQDFHQLNSVERLGNEKIANFRINGLTINNGKLLVNFMNRRSYKAASSTTFIVEQAEQFATSDMRKHLLLEGGLHASGWISQIPQNWQQQLNGNLIAGSPGATIPTMTTQGASAFAFNSNDLLSMSSNQSLKTNKLLGFSHKQPLKEAAVIDAGLTSQQILRNDVGVNELWTVTSNAVYGFIVPGTSTYLTIGRSSGHRSGIGYQIKQDSGNVCKEFCSYESGDEYGYIWLWDVADLIKVKNGDKTADSLTPYYYGQFDTPFGSTITGATFDAEQGRLFVAIADAEQDDSGQTQPLIAVYQFKQFISDTDNAQHCGDVLNGESVNRTRYLAPMATGGDFCVAEQQVSMCDQGVMSAWSGSYTSTSCKEITIDAPHADINNFKFIGGFRVTGEVFGETDMSRANNSRGIFTYNPENHSIFLVGSPKEEQIAEFAIPDLVNSTLIADLPKVETPLQNFTKIHGTDRVDTGIDKYFKVTGLEVINGKLLVNYVNWYDGNGVETDTTLYIENSNDLAGSDMYGAFQLDGKAHAAGWISKVPEEWQDEFEGSYIAGGQQGTSIISRLSVGPSAFVFNPEQSVFNRNGGAVATEKLMDFPLSNMLFDKNAYGASYEKSKPILYNENGMNDLWTIISGAGYGFIIPGTRTYITIGKSGGLESGVGYKITQENGYLCPGPCSYETTDNYSYYWMWDVEDLLKAKYGLLAAHDIRPQDHGKFPVPVDVGLETINGGSFDAATNTLYLSVPKADKLKQYRETPVFLAYRFEQ